jgi:hypothetical protein
VAAVPSPIFKLGIDGRPGDIQATLSGYDLTAESKTFVQEINSELAQPSGTLGPDVVRRAAFAVLRRHGLVVSRDVILRAVRGRVLSRTFGGLGTDVVGCLGWG